MPLTGVLYSFIAAILFSCSVTLFKKFGQGVSSSILALFKNTTVFLLLIGLIIFSDKTLPQFDKNFLLLCLSGAFGLVIGTASLYKSIKTIGLTKTSLGMSLVGPVSLILDYLIFEKIVSILSVLAVFLMLLSLFVSILSTKSEKVEETRTGLFYLTLCIMGNSISFIFLSMIPIEYDSTISTSIRLIPAVPFLVLVCFFQKNTLNKFEELKKIKENLKPLLFASGFCSLCGLYLMTKSTAILGAGLSASIVFTHPIWSSIIGKVYFKEQKSNLIYVSILINIIGISCFIADKTNAI